MIIDIQRTVIKIKLRIFVVILFFILLIIIVLFPNIVKTIFPGIDRIYFILLIIAICVLTAFCYNFLDLNYIYYNDEGPKIILRYYSLRILNKSKNSIEIPKKKLIKFESKKSFFNLKEKIILFQKMQNRIAKYPPVSISSLTKEQKIKLKNSLTKFSSNNVFL